MNVARNTSAFAAGLLLCMASARADDGPLIEARLLTPVSTIRRHVQKALVRAEITRVIGGDGRIIMPLRLILRGQVQQSNAVGLGLRRERASLAIEFSELETAAGEVIPIRASLVRVDNAREQVDKKGRIRGILAANNPLGVVRGVWYRPSPQLLLRPGGFTGASGTVWGRIALGPIGALGLFAAKLALTSLPEPEIDLPAGTDLILRMEAPLNREIWGDKALPEMQDPNLVTELAQLPFDIQKANGAAVPDVINIALVGSEAAVKQSFLAAGWSEAEPLNRGSFRRSYRAFAERSGYSTAPVSLLLYQVRPPDLVFQKSLNSIAKRHHVRFWRTEVEGHEVWLGAASHDVSVTFDRRSFMLSHRIDPNLDVERQKVLGDLSFVQAVASLSYAPRELEVSPAAKSDGRLAVATLQDPIVIQHDEPIAPGKVRFHFFRSLTRRLALESRQYLFRENIYYLGYLSVRRMIERHKNDAPQGGPAAVETIF